MFLSELFDLDLSGTGVFNALIDKDNSFFINIIRIKKAITLEFQDAYQHLNQFFSEIATLLDNAESATMSDPFYRSARKRFVFHEVNGINLGFSETRWGSGWGDDTSDQVLQDAFKIVKKGSKQPEIFHLVALFEDNVAGDRLSDMIATIIEPDIKAYTLRKMRELGINSVSYPQLNFRDDGLILNPYKSCPILMLPEEVLHELPIARGWSDIDRVESQNRSIRAEMSTYVSTEWYKWAATEKKQYIKQHVFMEPETCERVIEDYRNIDVEALDLRTNPDYLAELLLQKLKASFPFKKEEEKPTSFDGAMHILEVFKNWVENNRGWEDISNAPDRRKEKAVQRLIYLAGKDYMSKNDFDPSPEADSGRGPVDLKISRGNDKTIVEVKLSSNGQYIHGYQEQLEEYGKAEQTVNQVYVFIDVGNPIRLKTIRELHQRNIISGKPCPELVIIDARPKKAASTYTKGMEDSSDMSFGLGDFSDFDLTEIQNFDLSSLDSQIPE